jgi:N-methylhydantoinase B/oxoprolinase/acetone carboxylase alpha subunit
MSPKAAASRRRDLYIDPFKLVEDGASCEEAVLALLTKALPCARSAQNVADLKAQAANAGREELARW